MLNKSPTALSKIKYSLWIILIFLLGLFGYVHSVLAELSCNMTSQFEVSGRINLSTYAGNELPLGSPIYVLRVTPPSVIGNCTGIALGQTTPMTETYVVRNYPLGPAVTFNNLPVFPTNVTGVGVVISTTYDINTAFSGSKQFRTYSYNGSTANEIISSDGLLVIIITLIKTGHIDSGSVVDPSSFPPVDLFLSSPGMSTVKVWSADYTGAINFITSSCTTPSNVNVDMGSYGVSPTFNQTGSTTSWVDSSITLDNCPTFSGRHANQSTQQIVSRDMPDNRLNNRVATLLTVSLTPTSSIIDTANGVMAVDAAGSSGAAATGVGLQLGFTPNNINADATIPSTIWRPGMSWDVQPPNDGTSSFKIPLAARYYQTSNTVTAGPANARVTFNIDYK